MTSSDLTPTNSQIQWSELMTHTLMLDLETTRSGKIRHIGAILNGRVFEKKERAGRSTTLKQLDEFAGVDGYC